MKSYTFDFYNSASLRAYNLSDTMAYQLSILNGLDPITKRHSENVANLTCRICEYLRFKPQLTIHATMCGYLHDIGKLLIPPEIINKPGRLTEEEYELMKTHTTKGYEICMKHPELRPFAQVPLCHHEALDGSGYPNGLTKKKIPYAAQIVRVADEYDAIVHKRQYTTHVNISATLKELIKDAQPEEHRTLMALDYLKTNKKLGKINAHILKILFKVVIDDVHYEIDNIKNYVVYLNGEVKRLETIDGYYHKMENAKKEKDKEYFLEGMKLLFQDGETVENFQQVLKEYKQAIQSKENQIEKLHDEIKIIKKLRV